MNGPGKYDPLCTMVRELAGAHTAMIIVLGGNDGDGFSVQVQRLVGKDDARLRGMVSNLLRQMATEIERDANGH